MNTYKIIIAFVALQICIGCKKEFLDEEVFSSIYTEDFYRTASDAEGALTAAYGSMVEIYTGGAGIIASDWSSDQSYGRPVVGREVYALFNYDANYTTQQSFGRVRESPRAIWNGAYDGIEKANWVIEKVPDTNMDNQRKNEILGESYFLRAFYHWMLAKNFGNIVVKTSASTSLDRAYVANSPKEVVYNQILSDLEIAANSLPSYSENIEYGRASKEVALALAAKAALYAEEWSIALKKAQDVINSGKYSLMADVRDLYSVAKEDDARVENMWAYEVERTSPSATYNSLPHLYGPRSSNGPEYLQTSFGSAYAYQTFFDTFDPNDKRRLLLDTNYINKQGEVVPQNMVDPAIPNAVLLKKYQDPNSIGSSTAINIQILRLADVYLIASEAEARMNGATPLAYSYIDIIRQRAGLNNLSPGLSPDEFIDSVLQERSWEFFGEGDRWYDLTRTDKFLTAIPKAVNVIYPVRTPSAKNKYFPIPLDEINANPEVQQNPGWE